MVMNNIVDKAALRKVQLETMEVLENALLKSFGPYGSNTEIYSNDALPRYTKDGYTILSSIQFADDIAKSVQANIEEETRTQAVKVGDSTTSVTLLSAIIFKALVEYQESLGDTVTPRSIINDFKTVTDVIKDNIANHGKDATVEDMYKIALISTNGNEELAGLIAKIYKEYDLNVYIDVKASMTNDTYIKEINGMSLECGFLDPTLINDPGKNSCDIHNPRIYAFKDPIDTMEMGTLLDSILYSNILQHLYHKDETGKIAPQWDQVKPTVIMAPRISRDYSNYMNSLMAGFANVDASQKGYLNIITDITGADMEQWEDICDLCGCTYIKKYLDAEIQAKDIEDGNAPTPKTVADNFYGSAELVSSDANKTTFVNPQKMYDITKNEDGEVTFTPTELFNQRLDYLKKQIEKLKSEGNNTTDIYTLKKRLHSLEGKMVEIYIGGITIADRDAARDLMEDAALNCRSAAENGVGFGANFEGLRAAYEAVTEHKYISIDKVENPLHDIGMMIYNAYRKVAYHLYSSANDGTEDEINTLIDKSLKEGCPMNLSNNEFDGNVLSSIDTDICSLDTISKIVTIMATCNQFILPVIKPNVY